MLEENWSYVRHSKAGSVYADYKPKSFDDVLEVLCRNAEDVVLLFVDPGTTYDVASMLQTFKAMDAKSRMRFHDRIEVAACVVEDCGEDAMVESIKEYVRATFDHDMDRSNAVRQGKGALALSSEHMFVKEKGEQP